MQNEVVSRIRELKNRINAVILVHNYQPPEIQDLGDFCGDSLELSRKAAAEDADVIVFCGVLFMAETAAILSPEKTVVLPDAEAGCPMADMITAGRIEEMRAQNTEALVVSYVNTSAAVKARSDYCCTSGNALNVIREVKKSGRPIIFTPDRNLGSYVSAQTRTDMIICEGYCPVHMNITVEDIKRARSEYPEALVMVHPECRPEVADIADAVVSTSGMIRYAGNTDAKSYIVGTETGMLYPLKKHYPEKTFFPASKMATCHDMKRITLQKLLTSLELVSPVITVDRTVQVPARKALERMLEIA